MSTRIVETSDGTELSVRVTGRDDGPGMVLCDGIGCDGYAWKYIRRTFEPLFKVVHFHYRAHGLSAEPKDHGSLTIERCAADAWEVLDACGVDRAVFWGHSMGVQVMLEAAHQQPGRPTALIAACGAFEKPLDTLGGGAGTRALSVLSSLLFARPDTLRRLWRKAVPTELAYKIAVATEVNAKMIRREDFAPYLEHLARMDPVLFVRLLDNLARHTTRPYLSQIEVPVLVFAGSRDSLTPTALAEELVRLLPDAELCHVPGGSHTAPIELPDLFTLRAERFLRQRGLLPGAPARRAVAVSGARRSGRMSGRRVRAQLDPTA